jgi:hypothetical protein
MARKARSKNVTDLTDRLETNSDELSHGAWADSIFSGASWVPAPRCDKISTCSSIVVFGGKNKIMANADDFKLLVSGEMDLAAI